LGGSKEKLFPDKPSTGKGGKKERTRHTQGPSPAKGRALARGDLQSLGNRVPTRNSSSKLLKIGVGKERYSGGERARGTPARTRVAKEKKGCRCRLGRPRSGWKLVIIFTPHFIGSEIRKFRGGGQLRPSGKRGQTSDSSPYQKMVSACLPAGETLKEATA